MAALSAKQLKRDLREVAQAAFPLLTFWGFESEDVFRWFLDKRKFVYCDHAYFDRGYDKMNFRVLLSKPHQNEIKHDLPDDRMRRFCAFPRPWKQGSKVYVIPIQPMMGKLYVQEDWTEKTVGELQRHTDREIVVKPKDGPPLADCLRDAWAVVGHSSVACVEAAYAGVPVFGPSTSPAYGVGEEDLSKIEEPATPDREHWLRTLSYSQFHLDEIRSGEAWAILRDVWLSQRSPNSRRQ